MKNILITGDLHLSNTRQFSKIVNGKNNWIEIGLNSLRQLIDYSENNNNLPIIFLGDIFDLKDRVPTQVQNAFYDIITSTKSTIFLLVGNHDYTIKEEPTFKILNKFPNIKVIDSPTYEHILNMDCFFVPFLRDDKEITKIVKDNEAKILFIHKELYNAKYLSYVAKNDLTEKTLSKYEWVFAGHIHIYQELAKNIIHVGSLHQLEFNYNNDFCGFIELTKDGEINYHQTKAPRFVVVKTLNFKEEEIRGNFVKVKLELSKSEQLKLNIKVLRRELSNLGAEGITFDIKVKEKKEQRLEINKNHDLNDIIENYVNYKNLEGYDKNTLIKLGKSLLG